MNDFRIVTNGRKYRVQQLLPRGFFGKPRWGEPSHWRFKSEGPWCWEYDTMEKAVQAKNKAEKILASENRGWSVAASA